MTPNFLNIRRIQIAGFLSKWRMFYYKLLGLQYGENSLIGRITCDWPNNVKLGNNNVVLNGVNFGIGYGFDLSNTINIGDNVFIGYDVEFNCTATINVGNNVLIATGTKLLTVGHTFQKDQLINAQPLVSLPINVGDDVWIAANCVIIGGVTIGDGSVIGAGSVVTKSVPSFEVWGGVPAKFIKKRL